MIILSIVVHVLGIVAMVAWAAVVPSVWALVFGHIVVAISAVVLGHVFLSTYRHKFCLDRAVMRELIQFGKWITVGTAITFLAMQYDRILLGKLVPFDLLGTYSIALAVAVLPSWLVTHLAHSILFPLLSRSKELSLGLLHRQFSAARASHQ
jgi:O-antigen/teichoic acid export membrane protein